MRRGQKGGMQRDESATHSRSDAPTGGTGALKGRFQHEDSSSSRGHGQADAICSDPRKTSDVKRFTPLNAKVKVKRLGRGRPKQRPRYLLGDKAYDAQSIRRTLRRQHTTPVIPKRKNAKRKPRFNRGLYRERNRIERLINRLKQSRRIATRYEKRAENYLAMLTIAAIMIWLK